MDKQAMIKQRTVWTTGLMNEWKYKQIDIEQII